MSYVYLINTYDDHGPQELWGTMHRDKIEGIVRKFYKDRLERSLANIGGRKTFAVNCYQNEDEKREADRLVKRQLIDASKIENEAESAFSLAALAEIFLDDDETLSSGGSYALAKDWGGLQLHVVKLQ